MDKLRLKKTNLHRNYETHNVFLLYKVNQRVILFSCDFCEISKNTFFKEHLRATGSGKTEIQGKIMTSK